MVYKSPHSLYSILEHYEISYVQVLIAYGGWVNSLPDTLTSHVIPGIYFWGRKILSAC